MHAAGFPRPAPPSKLKEKISRTPQYWRPSNCLMQLCIQTCRSYEAKPGDGGTDDRYQATLIPSGGSGGGHCRRLVVEQRDDTEATLSSSDSSGSEAASRFFVAPSPDPLPPPSDLEQHRRTPREERDGGVGLCRRQGAGFLQGPSELFELWSLRIRLLNPMPIAWLLATSTGFVGP